MGMLNAFIRFFQTLPKIRLHSLPHGMGRIMKLKKYVVTIRLLQRSVTESLNVFTLELAGQLSTFFKGLYSLLGLSDLKAKTGNIDDHYRAFMMKNINGKCPFCGIHDVKGVQYHSKREAYDHYLPKGVYPFNSINFKNLAPACHECNSSYKLTKDPAYNPKDPLLTKTNGKRKPFYPYAANSHKIELNLKFGCGDWTDIKTKDIELTFGPEELREQITTWDDVYGIQERYKAKCCRENDHKYWIEQILDEWREDDRKPDDFLKALSRSTEKKPYAEANFLKAPFLNACKKAGLFDNLQLQFTI